MEFAALGLRAVIACSYDGEIDGIGNLCFELLKSAALILF